MIGRTLIGRTLGRGTRPIAGRVARTMSSGAIWKGRRSSRPVAASLALALLLVISACGDSGPGEPGTLAARAFVDASSTQRAAQPLGAVVLEVTGGGIRDFVGRGDTRVYWAAVDGRTNVHRVVLVHPEGGEIGFAIDVEDTAMDDPAVSVIEAAGVDNRVLDRSLVTVRIER